MKIQYVMRMKRIIRRIGSIAFTDMSCYRHIDTLNTTVFCVAKRISELV